MIRRRRYALAASLLGHGVALLALVYLLQRIVVPTPPPESSVSLVFAPPAPQQVTAASSEAPAAAAPPDNEQEPPPPPVQPEAKVEQVAPETPPPRAELRLPAPAEPSREATIPQLTRPAPVEHPPPRRVAVARPLAVAPAQPAVAPVPAPAAAAAPLLPAHPVAGMESDRPPVYPEVARRRGQQGRVVLEVSVSAEGMPVSVRVAQSSGYPSLDTAAQTAVERWRFVPATRGGAPVSAVAEVPVRFRLTE